jgi:nitrite reductase (NADH) large subunit
VVVNRYECEWANALKDPEKLKRFRTFVNDKRPTRTFTLSRNVVNAGRSWRPNSTIPVTEETV